MKPRPAATQPHSTDSATVSCVGCETSNPTSNRFCRTCGNTLWKRCAQCKAERPIDETFCAACGAEMSAAEAQLIESSERRLEEVRLMVERLDFDAALLALKHFLRTQDHPCLNDIRSIVQEMIPEVTGERDRRLQRCVIHVGRAHALLEEVRYQEALQELQQIPQPLRDEAAQQLLSRVESICQEITQLKQQIRQPQGISFVERMRKIERLLELQPNDSQVERWAKQVHDHLLDASRQKLAQRQYRESLELLNRIPLCAQSEASQKLLRQVTELEYLDAELRLAPTVTPVTLEAAKRLIRFDEGHPTARQALQEMTRRVGTSNDDLATRNAEWVACPTKTHVGLPVHDRREPGRMVFATSDIRRRFQQHPGQFFVACGLALQALQRSAISTNLLPAPKSGVLAKFGINRWERVGRSAWGLDLSHTSLKAIQLTVDEEEQIRITQCAYVAHREKMTAAATDAARSEILREVLSTFLSRHEINNNHRVATQWPSSHTLVRVLTVPPTSGKKYKILLEQEARRQIPFPLDEVCWDAYSYDDGEVERSFGPQQVLLLALRLRDVEARLRLFGESGIDVQVLQIDALALHNYLHYDWHSARDAKEHSPDGVVALDVGSDATCVLFSCPDFVWFRATRPAGDDVIARLARRFKITNQVAERVKRDPTKVKRLSDLHEELCVVYRNMVAQFEAAQNEFRKVAPDKNVSQMLVVGGAAQTHGLLRYLRFGR